MEPGLLKAYAALLASALLPIAAGAHSSLRMPKRWRKRSKSERSADGDSEDEDDDEVDRITKTEALLFPVIGSVVLLSLYLAFRYLDRRLINRILNGYFVLMGTAAIARLLTKLAKRLLPAYAWRKFSQTKPVNFRLFGESVKMGIPSITSLLIAAFVTGYKTMIRDHWLLANFTALSLAYNAVDLMRLDSFFTGSALLTGLFFYDIWWVFGTNVMESVARDLDGPVKIVWPKDTSRHSGFTLLGLGDIVLPGAFIALALRFDYANAIRRMSKAPKPSDRFKRPYFSACFIAYIAGLVTTIGVMHQFRAAQPALLYLSPACLLSVSATALWRGEWQDLWAYQDEDEDEKDRQEKREAEESDKPRAAHEEKLEGATKRGPSIDNPNLRQRPTQPARAPDT